MSEHQQHVDAFRRIREESRTARVNFLLVELQAGLSFLDTAEASRSDETRARTRALAREAYDVVARHLADETLSVGDDERAEIQQQHERLGARLAEAG